MAIEGQLKIVSKSSVLSKLVKELSIIGPMRGWKSGFILARDLRQGIDLLIEFILK